MPINTSSLFLFSIYRDVLQGRLEIRIRKLPNGKRGFGVSTYMESNYCGPHWGFTSQDVLSGTIAEMPEAINAIDKACQAHDQCYADHGYFNQACNEQLRTDLLRIVSDPHSSSSERMDASIMAGIFWTEGAISKPLHTIYKNLYDSFVLLFTAQQMTMQMVINWHLTHFPGLKKSN